MVDFGSFKQGSNELNTQKYHMTSLFCMNVGMLRFVPTYKLWSQILSEVGFPPEVQTSKNVISHFLKFIVLFIGSASN